ncbi:hypothetical protein [Nonomuraea basaltis]|uniref:hypothetical protein n=1 Tax=Nonomuraea basaltis TaxID=2495887 RepID=UPI001486F874|nr:hypothetical protein [Nonomuraea basaltis]
MQLKHRTDSPRLIVHSEQVESLRGGEPGDIVRDRALRTGHSGRRQSQCQGKMSAHVTELGDRDRFGISPVGAQQPR